MRTAARCASCGRWVRFSILAMCQAPGLCYHCGAVAPPYPPPAADVTVDEGGAVLGVLARPAVAWVAPLGMWFAGPNIRGRRAVDPPPSVRAWWTHCRPAMLKACERASGGDPCESLVDDPDCVEVAWLRWVPVRPDHQVALGVRRNLEPAQPNARGAFRALYLSRY